MLHACTSLDCSPAPSHLVALAAKIGGSFLKSSVRQPELVGAAVVAEE